MEHGLRILQLLACTRVATPHQFHTWLTPTVADTSTVRKHLRSLAKDGLVAANTERRPHIWFLTGAGIRTLRGVFRRELATVLTMAATGRTDDRVVEVVEGDPSMGCMVVTAEVADDPVKLAGLRRQLLRMVKEGELPQ